MKFSFNLKFQGLMLLSLIGLTNCQVAKTVKQLSNTDVNYTQYTNGEKEYLFVEMTHFAKPTFYQNVENSIEYAKENDYVLFYEYLDIDKGTDLEKRKLKEMTGLVPSPEGYALMLKPLLDQGYAIQDNDQFLGKVNDLDFNADVDLSTLLAAYEEKYGEIVITEENQNAPIMQAIKPSIPQEQTMSIIRDFRNAELAKMISDSEYDKIVVVYGAAHRPGLLEELQKIDSNWKQVPATALKEVKMLLPPNPIVEDGYIEKFENKLGVKLALTNDLEGFEVDAGNNRFEILPNTSTLTSIKLIYKSMSLRLVKFYPDLFGDDSDNVEKGETSNWSMGGNLNFKNWLNYLEYTKTKGYYLKNTGDFDPNWVAGDPYIQFPDLEYRGFHGTTGYKLNPKLSFFAFTLQTERQLKSAGSFIPRVYYRFFTIEDKTPITATSTSQKSNMTELLMGIGYYHTFVYNNFYFTAGLTPSIGKNYTKITIRSTNPDVESKQNSTLFRMDGSAALGYNGDRFFYGFETKYNASSYNQGNTTASIGNARFFYQLFLGYRFKMPKF